MTLTLKNFKKVIAPEILARGRSYFDNERVIALDMQEERMWLAEVEGSDLYEVDIDGSDGTLICSCPCPYEHGEYCKHVAAVLFAIEEQFPEYIDSTVKKTPAKSGKTDLATLVGSLSKEELIAFILEQASQDRGFANTLRARFSPDKTKSATFYLQNVNSILRAERDRDGYMDAVGTAKAARQLRIILNEANTAAARGEVDRAVSILKALISGISGSINRTEDENGDLYACAHEALSEMERLSTSVPPQTRAVIFDFCIQEAVTPRAKEAETRWPLLKIAARIFLGSAERERLFGTLDTVSASMHNAVRVESILQFGADQTHAVEIKLEVIRREDSPQAALDFMAKNVHLIGIRSMLITEHLNAGRLNVAHKLITEGIKLARQQNLPGLVASYQKQQLELAQREEDTILVKHLARELLTSQYDITYYHLLKTLVPPAEWKVYSDKLLAELQTEHRGTALAIQIYYQEDRWKDLLDLAPKAWHSVIPQYHEALEKRFPKAMVKLYEKQIPVIMKYNADRGGYRYIGELLRHIRGLGEDALAQELADELRSLNKTRRALLDELSKAGF